MNEINLMRRHSGAGDLFPLTPALSLRERGNYSPSQEMSDVGICRMTSANNGDSQSLFPLPQGEGQGEGEAHIRLTSPVRIISLTPWLQPGVKRNREMMNRFNGLADGRKAVETAGDFSSGSGHRAEATVLMGATRSQEAGCLSPRSAHRAEAAVLMGATQN